MWASLPIASSPEHCLPHIQFLFIGSRLCSTLLSDLTSRFGPCASLSLHLHLVVKRTCTSQLSIMLGTQQKAYCRCEMAVRPKTANRKTSATPSAFALSAEAPHDAALQPQAVLVSAAEMRVQILDLNCPKRDVPG